MALPAPAGKATSDGIVRSARLLRALGPRGADVWAELPPEDARRISAVMDSLPDDAADEDLAARALLSDSQIQAPASDRAAVWVKLQSVSRPQLLSILSGEHPQVVAFILGRLAPTTSAEIVRHLPSIVAIDVLQRMLHTTPPHPAALTAIEEALESRLLSQSAEDQTRETTLARIFDELDPQAGQTLLSALQTAEPEAGRRIQTLMFGFEDLAQLPPAGMQTLLSRTDRRTLTLAMTGANKAVADAVFRNMTSRARDMLKEEMAAIDQADKSKADAARNDMTRLARSLIASGDILGGHSVADDLIE